jgi:hypothetical protein
MLSTIVIGVAVLAFCLYVGIAWGVVRKYRQTHNLGFLLLGAGVILLPLLGQALRLVVERGSGASGIFPFSGVTEGEFLALFYSVGQAVQAALVLLGILFLGRAASPSSAGLRSPVGHAG